MLKKFSIVIKKKFYLFFFPIENGVHIGPYFLLEQGSYASGKCQGNLNFFKVREMSGNFMLCQGKMNFC